jgi:hypothetical protein
VPLALVGGRVEPPRRVLPRSPPPPVTKSSTASADRCRIRATCRGSPAIIFCRQAAGACLYPRDPAHLGGQLVRERLRRARICQACMGVGGQHGREMLIHLRRWRRGRRGVCDGKRTAGLSRQACRQPHDDRDHGQTHEGRNGNLLVPDRLGPQAPVAAVPPPVAPPVAPPRRPRTSRANPASTVIAPPPVTRSGFSIGVHPVGRTAPAGTAPRRRSRAVATLSGPLPLRRSPPVFLVVPPQAPRGLD